MGENVISCHLHEFPLIRWACCYVGLTICLCFAIETRAFHSHFIKSRGKLVFMYLSRQQLITSCSIEALCSFGGNCGISVQGVCLFEVRYGRVETSRAIFICTFPASSHPREGSACYKHWPVVVAEQEMWTRGWCCTVLLYIVWVPPPPLKRYAGCRLVM